MVVGDFSAIEASSVPLELSEFCKGEPMKPGFVHASATELIFLVDEGSRVGPHAFEQMETFLVAEQAMICTK